MNDRLKELRNELNLSGELFGKKLGVTKQAISKIEKGDSTLTEQMLLLICKEFNVNYFWLRDGLGEMFIDIPDTVLDEMEVTYDMTPYERTMIERYLKLSKQERIETEKILKKLFNIQ